MNYSGVEQRWELIMEIPTRTTTQVIHRSLATDNNKNNNSSNS